MISMVPGLVLGTAAGLGVRALVGDAGNPCRHRDGALWYAGAVTAPWWVLAYPLNRPDLALHLVGFGMGYLLGHVIGTLVGIIRAGRPDDDDGGSGGGGGGGGWTPPEPWPGPYGPHDRVEARPFVYSDITTADFDRETTDHKAPAEPALVGR